MSGVMRDRPTPACAGLPWLFESTRQEDHEQARTLCVDQRGRPTCPAFANCENTVRDILDGDYRSGLHGTWAGKLYAPDAAKWKRINEKRNAKRKAAREAARK